MNRTVEDVRNSLPVFQVLDYVVFVLMPLFCIGIGLYFGVNKKNVRSGIFEYFLGGGRMPILPVAVSLIASFTSGVAVVGITTDAYLFGSGILWVVVANFTSAAVIVYVYLPVFKDLNIVTTYEYLERRFNSKVRLLASGLFTVVEIALLPLISYVPALALNQIVGGDVLAMAAGLTVICIIYTAIGGFKAVVWTDFIQMIILTMSLILLAVFGTLEAGSFSAVMNKGLEGGRIEMLSFSFDYTEMYTFWGIVFGQTCIMCQRMTTQDSMQRYMSLPSLKLARWSLILMVLGITFVLAISYYIGLTIYFKFHDCDPITTKLVLAKDQMFPLIAQMQFARYPGLLGLFVSGIYSAAFSTISTILNSISFVIIEDFIKTFWKREISHWVSFFLCRGLAAFVGAVGLCLIFIIPDVGTVLQVSKIIMGNFYGPILGLFISGLLVPWVNSKGAISGTLIGVIMNTVVNIGMHNAKKSGKLKYPTKPLFVNNCDYTFNITLKSHEDVTPNTEYVFPLFKMSYLYLTLFGALVTLFFAILISWCTGFNDLSKMDEKTVCPFIRKYLPQKKREEDEEAKELMVVHRSNGLPILHFPAPH